jgi:hypothetical protein
MALIKIDRYCAQFYEVGNKTSSSAKWIFFIVRITMNFSRKIIEIGVT